MMWVMVLAAIVLQLQFSPYTSLFVKVALAPVPQRRERERESF
jgi:hypothetical protein